MDRVGDSKKYGKLRGCAIILGKRITYFTFNIKF